MKSLIIIIRFKAGIQVNTHSTQGKPEQEREPVMISRTSLAALCIYFPRNCLAFRISFFQLFSENSLNLHISK